jgi:hypothetical protein
MTKISPLQVAFYKGMGGKWGAVQFNLRKPHYFCEAKDTDGNPCRSKVYDQALPPQKCPTEGCSGSRMKSKEGFIYMDICSTKGRNEYDWSNKITLQLNVNDIGKILTVIDGTREDTKGASVEIMHDPGARTHTQGKIQKWFSVSSPNGVKDIKNEDGKPGPRGGCMLRVVQKGPGDERKDHQVPLSSDETARLAILLKAAIATCSSWN